MKDNFTFDFNCPSEACSGIPALSGTLGRINVVLGANGSGKSKFLQALISLRSQVFPSISSFVYVEGGRALNIDVNLTLSSSNLRVFAEPHNSRIQHAQTYSFSERLRQTFVLITALDIRDKGFFADEIASWQAQGESGPSPKASEFRFPRLVRLFGEMFPNLKLYTHSNGQLYISAGESEYPASSLSDGEKQVLVMLADLVVLHKEQSIFLVDEPELNLHPQLAEKLWSLLENNYPESVFIYASHSLSFALREEVDAVFFIGLGQIARDDLLQNRLDVGPFLGSIPGIVGRTKCLFVEGNDKSLDSPLYKWITGFPDLSILPVPGSKEVLAAASRSGIWHNIAPSMKVAGVIDRDFQAGLGCSVSNVHVLDFHEIESYLCQPELVVALNKKLKNGPPVSEEDVVEILVEQARKRLTFVVAQRVFSRYKINHTLSLERSVLSAIKSPELLLEPLIAAAESNASFAAGTFTKSSLETIIEEEAKLCKEAIGSRDVEQMLRFFEAKEPLRILANRAGCPTPVGMVSAVTEHLVASDFPHLKLLKESLESLFE